MKFWLGTHLPHWLNELDVPLFVSRRRLARRKALPRARGPWALDSGGFSELSLHGAWSISVDQYAAEVRCYRDEIGNLAWAATCDFMCEPAILARTGLSVQEHQKRTVCNYLELRERAPEIEWLPVLQGWDRGDYLRCVELYSHAGVDLASLPLVGLGSVCRRSHLGEAEAIVHALQPLRLHAFGFKVTALSRLGRVLASADSMAWSHGARWEPPLPGCPHKHCGNCMRYALAWRERVIARTGSRAYQMELDFERI
jgi:hypothetical protein